MTLYTCIKWNIVDVFEFIYGFLLKWSSLHCQWNILCNHAISPYCHIYASMNWVIIGPGNNLLPVWCHAITWTNAGLLSIGLLGTYFSEIWIGILTLSFRKMQFKMLSAKIEAILARGRWFNISISLIALGNRSLHEGNKIFSHRLLKGQLENC